MTRSLVGNPGDEEQVEKAKLTQKERRVQELEDVKSMLAVPWGRRIFWRLARESEFFRAHVGNGDSLFWAEGKRALLAMVFNDGLEIDPSGMARMLSEGAEKERRQNG